MIFFEHRFTDNNEKLIEFSAIEDDKILGKCTLDINNEFALVNNIEFSDGNGYIVEGLIKSAFNYAANRNFFIGRCSADNAEFCFKRMNFVKCEGYYENDIPSILTGRCKGCS